MLMLLIRQYLIIYWLDHNNETSFCSSIMYSWVWYIGEKVHHFKALLLTQMLFVGGGGGKFVLSIYYHRCVINITWRCKYDSKNCLLFRKTWLYICLVGSVSKVYARYIDYHLLSSVMLLMADKIVLSDFNILVHWLSSSKIKDTIGMNKPHV
jgi:hypothetical protein